MHIKTAQNGHKKECYIQYLLFQFPVTPEMNKYCEDDMAEIEALLECTTKLDAIEQNIDPDTELAENLSQEGPSGGMLHQLSELPFQ